MATTDLGKVSVTPKGAWSNSSAYEALDIVTNSGRSYMAKKAVPSGTALTNTTYWLQLTEKGDAATIAVGTTTTGAAGSSASVTNSGDSHAATFNFTIPKGDKGDTGNGIASVEKIDTTLNVDTYRISFTDGDHFDYTVTNASSGVWGSITGTLSDQTDLVAELDDKADIITVSASGDIVSIADGSPHPVKALSVDVTAVQDLHGHDNPWPAGGGTNLWGGIKLANDINDALTATLNTTAKTIAWASNAASSLPVLSGTTTFKADTRYTLILDGTGSGPNNFMNLMFKYTDGTTSRDENVYIRAGVNVSTSGKTVESIIGRQYADTTVLNYDKCGLFEGVKTATDFVPWANICPISGWTGANVTRTGRNMFDHSKATILSNALSDTNGTFSNLITDTRTYLQLSIIAMNENTAVNSVSSFAVDSNGVVSRTLTITHPCTSIRVKHNGLTRDIGIQYPWTLQGDVTISINVQGHDPTTVGGLVLKDIQFELGSTATSYVPYSGTTLPISWQSSAGTVYGALLDVLAGTLTVTHASITEDGTHSWANGTSANKYRYNIVQDLSPASLQTSNDEEAKKSISDKYVALWSVWNDTNPNVGFLIRNAKIYVRFGENTDLTTNDAVKTYFTNNPTQFVYPLATPVTYTLDPETLTTLLGDNVLWADCGQTAVEYRADTGKYVERRLSEGTTAVKALITTTTTEMKAPKNLTSGDIIIVNDDLYKATANISNGSALTVGTNVVKITLAEWVASLTA